MSIGCLSAIKGHGKTLSFDLRDERKAIIKDKKTNFAFYIVYTAIFRLAFPTNGENRV